MSEEFLKNEASVRVTSAMKEVAPLCSSVVSWMKSVREPKALEGTQDARPGGHNWHESMTDGNLARRMEHLLNVLDSSTHALGKEKAFVDNWTYVLRLSRLGRMLHFEASCWYEG